MYRRFTPVLSMKHTGISLINEGCLMIVWGYTIQHIGDYDRPLQEIPLSAGIYREMTEGLDTVQMEHFDFLAYQTYLVVGRELFRATDIHLSIYFPLNGKPRSHYEFLGTFAGSSAERGLDFSSKNRVSTHRLQKSLSRYFREQPSIHKLFQGTIRLPGFWPIAVWVKSFQPVRLFLTNPWPDDRHGCFITGQLPLAEWVGRTARTFQQHAALDPVGTLIGFFRMICAPLQGGQRTDTMRVTHYVAYCKWFCYAREIVAACHVQVAYLTFHRNYAMSSSLLSGPYSTVSGLQRRFVRHFVLDSVGSLSMGSIKDLARCSPQPGRR